VITAALAAIGLIDPPAPELTHDERRAAHAKQLAQITVERTEHDLIARSQLGAFHAERDAQIAKLTSALEAHEHQQSIKVADDARAELLPLFAQWQEQPSRKIALAVQAAIRDLKVRVQRELGADLDPVFIASAFASTLVATDEALLSVFATVDAYTGEPIAAATALVQHAESPFVTHTESELTRLEHAIEHLARTAPRSPKNASYVAQHEALVAHAVRARRAEAVSALRGRAPAYVPTAPYVPMTPSSVQQVQVDFAESDSHFARLNQ
jgi:hypothetical protein